jgi:DNA repair protein RecO (recombination protein O)
VKTYKTKGIVLNTLKYGESSLIAYMLTDTIGRCNYMIQGVYGSRKRGNKAALLQPMFLLDIVGLESERAEMHRIKEMQIAVPLSSLPFDVRKSTIALFMAETLYRLVREVEPDSPLFDFVWNAAQALDAAEEGVANFHLWFMVQISYYLGFYPGNEYAEGGWFDIRDGLFRKAMPDHRIALDPENAAILHEFMQCGMENIGRIKLSRVQRSAFLNAMLDYFSYHLDTVHHIKSLNILKEVF